MCLTVEGADEAFIKAMAGALEKEGAAFDVAGYRDAPAGLRIWCGATVDTADIEALGPWLDWAYATAKNAAYPTRFVIPAKAGIQTRRSSKESQRQRLWIPAFAGMTTDTF